MFYKFFRVGLLSLCLFNVNAESTLPTISEGEANKYEVEYLKEYEELKKRPNESIIKWIQPKNKKESCKVYVAIDSKNDHTLTEKYALYWDGDCKDGYAYGLGREIEYRDYSYQYQIGIYKNGMPEDYCVKINNVEGIRIEGECYYSKNKADHGVWRKINNQEGDIFVEYRYGAFGSNQTPLLLTYSTPFSDNTKHYKAFSTFTYLIHEQTHDEFQLNKYTFRMLDKNKIQNGYELDIRKDGSKLGGEFINGKMQKRVILPYSYEQKMKNILLEIKDASNKALWAQEKAKIITTKYKMKICRDKVKVDFMENDEYKSLCEEDKKFEQLRVKINDKLDRLNVVKQQKLQQLNEDKKLNAQQNADARAEVLVKQRAAIAEEALEEQRRANLNQGFQNLNQTLQLQQMNRNMSWDALTPKRYDVYMH